MNRSWNLLCFLIVSLADSSSLTTHFLPVTCKVGEQVVLPCSWKPRLSAPASCHIQWQSTTTAAVFEQQGARRWQAEGYSGRVEVPEEKLGSGDCSLVISDVQITDTGRYESFMVVDGERSRKTRVFIQGVKLSVFDRKIQQARGPGGNLVLDLVTPHSVRVVFQGRNSSEWTQLWMKGDSDSERLEKDPLREQLTLKSLQRPDEGTYKVLDQHGLAVSTVQLTVQLNVHGESPDVRGHDEMENEISGDAVRSSRSLLLLCFTLVTSFQIPRLF
ncbi:galectin 17 [Pleuronectes platessa]|uniref:galectin 17 n=1 Tax=Pleuronectes platessa TaxID=8262 RepID=UPI00232A5407|nr:galectin 17 [Pleuronectes platessa]